MWNGTLKEHSFYRAQLKYVCCWLPSRLNSHSPLPTSFWSFFPHFFDSIATEDNTIKMNPPFQVYYWWWKCNDYTSYTIQSCPARCMCYRRVTLHQSIWAGWQKMLTFFCLTARIFLLSHRCHSRDEYRPTKYFALGILLPPRKLCFRKLSPLGIGEILLEYVSKVQTVKTWRTKT